MYILTNSVQLDLHEGDKVFILDKVNDKWWWVELNGKPGYAPVNHLSPAAPVVDEDEDRWQDSEYFSSYCSLVRDRVFHTHTHTHPTHTHTHAHILHTHTHTHTCTHTQSHVYNKQYFY